MKSNARPLWLTFDPSNLDQLWKEEKLAIGKDNCYWVIYKNKDDVRQDTLVISLIKAITPYMNEQG